MHTLCKHGSDCIDFGELYGKEVIVVGGGASGLDNSAAALESGAKAVTLISRRGHFPMVNTAVRSVDPKHLAGFADLPAHERKRLLAAFIGAGIPPPRLSIQRLLGFHNFCHRAFDVIRANTDGKRISLLSSNETITADFVILCTGFEGAPLKRPELETLVASSNVVPVSNGSSEDIEFAVDRWHRLSPRSTQDQWVRQIYYLGPGCKARHGVTAGDIVSLPLAATRIAESIASAHFREHIAAFHQLIESDS